MNKNLKQIAVPLVSVLLGLVLGAIIMWAFSYDALWGYELLFKKAFGSTKSWGNISRAMGPLILVALGFSGGDIPCKYSSVYSSVMGRGEATYLESIDEKSHGLQVLMKHQTGREFTFTEAMVNSVGVVQIKIVDYTAKRRRRLEQDTIMPPLTK